MGAELEGECVFWKSSIISQPWVVPFKTQPVGLNSAVTWLCYRDRKVTGEVDLAVSIKGERGLNCPPPCPLLVKGTAGLVGLKPLVLLYSSQQENAGRSRCASAGRDLVLPHLLALALFEDPLF